MLFAISGKIRPVECSFLQFHKHISFNSLKKIVRYSEKMIVVFRQGKYNAVSNLASLPYNNRNVRTNVPLFDKQTTMALVTCPIMVLLTYPVITVVA